MPEAVNISAFPKIGPTGLAIDQLPEFVRAVNITDVFEGIRWIHADLRQIHIAFRSVYELQREMAGIRGLATLQKAQFKAQANIVQDLAKRLKALSLIVDGRLSGQSSGIQELSESLSGVEDSIQRNLQEVTSRINEEIEQNQQAQQLVSEIVNQKLNVILDRQSSLDEWLRRPWWKKFWESLIRGSRAVR